MRRQPLAARWTPVTISGVQPTTTTGSFSRSSGAGRSPYQRVNQHLRWWPYVANGASPGICPAILKRPDIRQAWIGQMVRANDCRLAPRATPKYVLMLGAPAERPS